MARYGHIRRRDSATVVTLHVPMRSYPETDQEMTDYFESMIDALQATPQALQLMNDLIAGQVDVPPSVPRAFHPLIRAVVRPAPEEVIRLPGTRRHSPVGSAWSSTPSSGSRGLQVGVLGVKLGPQSANQTAPSRSSTGNVRNVATFPKAGLYDPGVLRTVFLTFESDDWEQELADLFQLVGVACTSVERGVVVPVCIGILALLGI